MKMSLFYFLWEVLTKSDQPAREPYIFGNCGRPAAKNTFQGFAKELLVEDIIAPLKGSLVLPKVCKKLFPRFGGEIKTGGWAGRGLPSWNKVQTNMHSHFQDWEKNGSVKYFLLTGTMLQQISIFTSNLQKVKVKMIPSDGNNAQNNMQLEKKELDGNTVKLPFIPQKESETSPLLHYHFQA